MALQITFLYFSHELQSFRRQLSKFEPKSLFSFKLTGDRSEQVLIFSLKWNLLYRGKWLGSGFVNLNEVVQAQMMLNDREGQRTLLLQKFAKKP